MARQSQFIIATHSPILMAYPHATIYQFGAEAPRRIEVHRNGALSTTDALVSVEG